MEVLTQQEISKWKRRYQREKNKKFKPKEKKQKTTKKERVKKEKRPKIKAKNPHRPRKCKEGENYK